MILSSITMGSTGWHNSSAVNLDLKELQDTVDIHDRRVSYYDAVIVPMVLNGNVNTSVTIMSSEIDADDSKINVNSFEIETENGLAVEFRKIDEGTEEEQVIMNLDIDATSVLRDNAGEILDIYNNNVNVLSSNLDISIDNPNRTLNINQYYKEYTSDIAKQLHTIEHNFNRVLVETHIYKIDEYGNYKQIIAKVDFIDSNKLRIILTEPTKIKCICKI